MDHSYDCQSCGACCSGLGVDVYGDDDVPDKFVKNDRLFGPSMRERKGCCICLKGKIGVRVRCSIYDQRPTVCREFQPGSQQCLDSRKRNGLG